ncbi:MAG: hypothetical protein ACP5JH_05580 [Bacteroidota bacterium]
MRNAILFLFCTCAALSVAAFAQSVHEGETNPEVKELKQYHAVIYKLWHVAWPKKDVGLMRSLAPAIEAGYTNLTKAELPGILRDKKSAWESGVKDLGITVHDYKSAVEGTDTALILRIAEKLHAQYEGLVRLIKPTMKEIDDFHRTLYMLYHHYLPAYDTVKIRTAVIELQAKMQVLNSSELPSKFASKKAAFEKARDELSKSLLLVRDALEKGQGKKEVVAAIEKMHTSYRRLENIFE